MSSTAEQVQHVADIVNRVTPYSAGSAASGGFIAWTVNSQAVSPTLAVGGFIVAVAAFAVNWCYRHKTY